MTASKKKPLSIRGEHFFEYSEDIFHSDQVAILVLLSRNEGLQMGDFDAVRQRVRVAKVDHPDAQIAGGVVSEKQTASNEAMRPEERRVVERLTEKSKSFEESGGQIGVATSTKPPEFRRHGVEILERLEVFGRVAAESLDGLDAESQAFRRRNGVAVIHVAQLRDGSLVVFLLARRLRVDPDHLFVQIRPR